MNIILAELRPDGSDSPERSFEQGVILVGRDASECDIAYDNAAYPMVSRRHAELRWDNGRWMLVDLNSSYGTFLNGRPVTAPESIPVGGSIQFGQSGPVVKVVWFEVQSDSLVNFAPPAAPQSEAPVRVPDAVPPFAPVEPRPPAAAPPAARPAAGAVLTFSDLPDRAPIILSNDVVSFGRDPECTVVFPKSRVIVSRRHAEIRPADGGHVIADNNSFNGTMVNGQRISAPTPLYHNDEIMFGRGGPVVRYESPARPAPKGASLAGQRSVVFGGLPASEAAEFVDGSKTMVAKLDRTPAAAGANKDQPQLLMTVSFNGRKELTVGRAAGSDIKLDGLQISNRHARFTSGSGGVAVEDLNSTNGVYVNGGRVSSRTIGPDDAVQIGAFLLRSDGADKIGVWDTRSKTRIDAVGLTTEIKGARLLDAVSLSFKPNEFVGILGPSGAGKSMLMNALSGVRAADSGSVIINGLDLYRHLDSLKQSIGFVPQEDVIHRELTVHRTLYYTARLRLSRDVSAAEIARTIDEVLDVTGLAERRDVRVDRLSGGQRKRVSIAVELITRPSVIYLDEPTSGLDPRTEEMVMRLFRQIAESGRTVIMTTHAMENVALFDKIVVLMRGRLAFYGPPDEALRHFGAANFKELYDKLEDPVEDMVSKQGESARFRITDSAAEQWKQKYLASKEYQANIAEPQKEIGSIPPSGMNKRRRLGIFGSVRQLLILSRRYAEVLLKDKLNLLILFAQAPIIALLTFLVMGADEPRDFVYFVLALVSVWFGTSVSAREIIRERPIYQRERMVNLGILPYVGSKLLVLGFIVGLQCLMLFIPLKFFDIAGLMPMPGELFGIPQLWVMLLTAGVGLTTGLFVSALVRTTEMAASLVPLILIPQLLFSGIAGVPIGVSRVVSMAMPAAWSFDTMKRFSTLDTIEPEGSDPNGRHAGLGLIKHTEAMNDKIILDARGDLEKYQQDAEGKFRTYDEQVRGGMNPAIPRPAELPAMPAAKKIPDDLSAYITFLHPWMPEVLNQIVLMLMFGMMVLATLIVLRLQDII